MNLLVTGGTGFLGRHCLPKALSRGWEVKVLHRSNPPETAQPMDRLEWIRGELAAPPAEVFDGVDCVLHLAATGVSPQRTDFPRALQVNLMDAMSFASAAVAAGVGRFIVAGTVAEYGRTFEEGNSVPVDAPLRPVGPYACSKAAASVAFLGLARTGALELAVLRVSHVFGEGQFEGNLWPSIASAARHRQDLDLTAGEQVYDFVPVEQAAEDLVRACSELPLQPGEPRVLHVCSGQPRSLRSFVEGEWERLGGEGQLRFGALPYRAGEMMRCVPELTPW